MSDFERMLAARMDAATVRGVLGEALHGLNLAAKQIDALGGDSSVVREVAAVVEPVRYAA